MRPQITDWKHWRKGEKYTQFKLSAYFSIFFKLVTISDNFNDVWPKGKCML